jgi:hypothetical protein
MSQEEVEKKARNLALDVLPAKKVEQLIEQCRHLDEMKDVSELTR